MTTTTHNSRVLIIGAGLAGLSLAQGLKRASPPIPFHIFERDPDDGFRPQGYRIRLSQEGTDALRTMISESLWQAVVQTSADTGQGGQRINALTGEAGNFTPQSGPPKEIQKALKLNQGPSYSVDRGVLRTVLLDGLEDHISFNKKFDSYVVRPDDGTVEAKFSDGTSELGCLVIGADGNRSAIRHHLLPNLTVLDTDIRAIFGKSTASPDTLSRAAEGLQHATCVFNEGERSHTIMYSEYLRFKDDFDGAAALKKRFNVPEDYLYWVICYHAEGTSSDDTDDQRRERLIRHLSMAPEETKQKVMSLTHDWQESARIVPQTLIPSSTATLSFVVSDKESFGSEWDRLRTVSDSKNDPVTLLGDAAHPSPPLGRGGNSAFEEAAELYRNLLGAFGSGSANPPALLEALVGYETALLEKAKPWVEMSALGASKLFGMKPVGELKPVDL